ncbi:MAG: ABC transporter ATP-binding protein [Bacteroidetes bacterium]|nr:ABC transporter ATP-binding protein [Bacteroidota bacterium]
MIKISNLSFAYNNSEILKNISLNIPEGEITVLIGSNGSGKTTLLNILLGLLKLQKGEIEILENKNLESSFKKNIGTIFQTNTCDNSLSVLENLVLHSKFYSIPKSESETRINYYLKIFSLETEKNKLVKKLSGGAIRKLEVIKSILHNPKLLIYDEPFVNIDVETKNEIWKILYEEVRKNKITLIFTTHNLNEADYAKNIVIIKKGEIVFKNTLSKFKNMLSYKLINLPVHIYKKYKSALLDSDFIQLNKADSLISFKSLNSKSIENLIKNSPNILKHAIIKNPEIEDIYLSTFMNPIK